MKLVPFKAMYPNLGLIASPESFFSTVKSQFTDYKSSGFFKKDDEKSLFIYELTSQGKSHRAIVACTDIADFMDGRILKHENTIAVKEQKMMNLMLQNRAMVKPVLLAYDALPSIDKIINKVISENDLFLDFHFKEIEERHRVWKVSNSKTIASITKIFYKDIEVSYIADGHHRVKTCQLLNETNLDNEALDTGLKNVLTAYFSWDQLSIHAFNRCVDAFQNYSPIEFMARVSKVCKIKLLKSAKKPSQKHKMNMYLYGEWYQLSWKKSILDKHKNETVLFDTFLLNEYILKGILNVTNVREDNRLRYIEGTAGTQGLENMVNENQNRVGFCMYPIASEDVKKIAINNKTLPPKSTWFEPRIKNGLLVKGF